MFQILKLRLRNKIRCHAGNKIEISDGVNLRKNQILIKGSNNTLTICDNVNIKGSIIEIDGDNCHLTIGNGCVIGEGCYISCREKNTVLTIGDECMLSRNIKIMTSDGHDIYHDGKRINYARNIKIGNQVWLADNVTVMKGAEIGSGSVVGINTLVCSTVGSNMIVVGNPAKVIRNNIHWNVSLTY